MITPPLSRTLAAAIGLSLAVMAPAHAGTLSGKISFKGAAPKAEALSTDADPICKKMHASIPSEVYVVAGDGGLKNVFVYVKEGLEGQTFKAPSDAVELDQVGCQYKPHVIGAMVKQKIEIVNSDDTLHNVHPLPKENREWNLAMPFKGQKVKKSFRKAEVGIPVSCNVHSWMRSYICVVDNPYFAVSGDDGSFTIDGLPDGAYTIAAWHEELGEKTAKVTVSGATTTSFTFE
jgi:plastocyanin